MTITRARLLWLALAGAAAISIGVLMRPAAVPVDVAAVVRGPLQLVIEEEGVTRLSRRFVVAAPVSGRVRRIDLRPGDAVARGASIAAIDPAPPAPVDARTQAGAEARVRSAEAAAGRARVEQQRAVIERQRAAEDLARVSALFATGVGTRESIEIATTRLSVAEQSISAADFAVRAADFEIAQARAVLISGESARQGQPVVVRAPIAGLLLRRVHESEAVVAAGTPLVEIGTLDDLEVVSDLLTTDAVKVRPGAPVYLDRWGGDEVLPGIVDRVEPAGFVKISALGVEEQRVNVVVRFSRTTDAPVPLGDGFRVGLRIVIWEHPDVLQIPTSSVFRRGAGWATFVVTGGRLVTRPVVLGPRSDRHVQVIEGVSAGETVVLYPGESLAEGVRVTGRLLEER
jgi:HlyD family secretion protein